MHKDNVLACFSRARLQNRIVVLWAEHSSGWAEQKIRAVCHEGIDNLPESPVRANHHSGPAKGRHVRQRTAAGRVAHCLVAEMLLVILADSLSTRTEKNGGVESLVTIGFKHSRNEMNSQLSRQRAQLSEIRTAWDSLPQCAVVASGMLLSAIAYPSRKHSVVITMCAPLAAASRIIFSVRWKLLPCLPVTT